MQQAATMFEKIWADHVIVAAPEGEDLLYVDLNFMNEGGAFLAFDQLRLEGRKVHARSRTFRSPITTYPPPIAISESPGFPILKFVTLSRCRTTMRGTLVCRTST